MHPKVRWLAQMLLLQLLLLLLQSPLLLLLTKPRRRWPPMRLCRCDISGSRLRCGCSAGICSSPFRTLHRLRCGLWARQRALHHLDPFHLFEDGPVVLVHARRFIFLSDRALSRRHFRGGL